MLNRLLPRLCGWTLLALAAPCAFGAAAEPATPAQKISPDQLAFFEKKIRPVLVAKCYECHSTEAKKLKGGLYLDTRDGIRHSGDSGHAVEPRSLKDSLLIKAIRWESKDLQMPPKEKLSAEVIADFEKWVLMGAPDPREGKAKLAAKPDPAAAKSFWAFQLPQRKPSPPVKDAKWPATDIDRFILAALESKGLKPVADADRVTLLRRVSFDLLGLPPTPEQVRAFLADKSPKAFEQVVDGLLASPQFGERWGRHWLDVARYAESSGKERNYTYTQAWRYRDWVIAAFNADKPYDQFIREQVAGDLLPAKDAAERNEHLVATGFLAMGPKGLNERNRDQFIMDNVDEQIDVTTRAVLGLTVSCARCHDHKFDPIPTREYYAVAGIFKSTDIYYGTADNAGKNRQPSRLLPLAKDGVTAAPAPASTPVSAAAIEAKPASEILTTAEINAKLAKLAANDPKLAQRLKKMTPVQRAAILEQLQARPGGAKAKGGKAAKAAKKSPGETVADDASVERVIMGVLDGKPANCAIYIRGELEEKGPVIPRGYVSVLGTLNAPKVNPAQSGRLELAQWLTASDNPLTARVAANRVWQHLFGEGLVTTADNFGATGERPSHPELLDHLALKLMAEQWSIKKLVRAIVLSHTYQLSSAHDANAFAADPDNNLLWRANQRRLDAESIRDAALAASGQLDLSPARGSVITELGNTDIGRTAQRGALRAESRHRSVYLPIVRDMVPEALDLFDFAEPSLVVANRDVTNVPSQALYMLNSAFIRDQSAALAKLIAAEADTARRVEAAYVRVLSRPPTAAEQARAGQYLAKLTAEPGCTADTAWTTFCHALLASAEFRYLR